MDHKSLTAHVNVLDSEINYAFLCSNVHCWYVLNLAHQHVKCVEKSTNSTKIYT